jgi:hypothetical protein
MKYQDIAMHFNDLIIKVRTQALGAVAAIVTITTHLGRNESEIYWQPVGIVSLILLCFWGALFLLDYFYYMPLLRGAVAGIQQIEHYHPYIKISTIIEMKAKHHRKVIKLFYGIIALVLLSHCAYCLGFIKKIAVCLSKI